MIEGKNEKLIGDIKEETFGYSSFPNKPYNIKSKTEELRAILGKYGIETHFVDED